jgi:hypothetical protein
VAYAAVDGDMAVSDIDPSFVSGIDEKGRGMSRDQIFICVVALSVIGSFVERVKGRIFVKRLFRRKFGKSAVYEHEGIFADGQFLVKREFLQIIKKIFPIVGG